jgi:hypothetical protein
MCDGFKPLYILLCDEVLLYFTLRPMAWPHGIMAVRLPRSPVRPPELDLNRTEFLIVIPY